MNEPRHSRASGVHETRLARNYLALQSSQVVALVTGLVVTTVLARRLTLDAFGTYALLLSLTTYLIVLQGVVEASAVRALAAAPDEPSRRQAFSVVVVVYSAAGVVGAALVAGIGWALLDIWSIPARLESDAHSAVLGLAVVMLLSWPARVFYEVLRGNQQFGLVGAAEAAAAICSGVLVIILALAGTRLSFIVTAAASRSLILGIASGALARGNPLLRYRFSVQVITRAELRSFLGLSGWFLLASISDFVIYSLDRTILGAFRSARTVGLYEGPVRAHYLVRDVQASVSGPILPAAARYHRDADWLRLHDLLLRGMRYMLAIVVPIAIVPMVLARPLLEAWLGQPFGAGASALTILVGYWLVYATTGVGWQMLVAVGQIRTFALYVAAAAVMNAALSLALTPSLGLNGVVLGTAIPYVLAVPVYVRLVPRQFGVTIRELVRDVWLPAYSTGALVAVVLVALRLTTDLASIEASLVVGIAAALAFWAIYYVVWLRPEERLLVRTLVAHFVARR